jgi:hypothetical protein
LATGHVCVDAPSSSASSHSVTAAGRHRPDATRYRFVFDGFSMNDGIAVTSSTLRVWCA